MVGALTLTLTLILTLPLTPTLTLTLTLILTLVLPLTLTLSDFEGFGDNDDGWCRNPSHNLYLSLAQMVGTLRLASDDGLH